MTFVKRKKNRSELNMEHNILSFRPFQQMLATTRLQQLAFLTSRATFRFTSQWPWLLASLSPTPTPSEPIRARSRPTIHLSTIRPWSILCNSPTRHPHSRLFLARPVSWCRSQPITTTFNTIEGILFLNEWMKSSYSSKLKQEANQL